MAPPAGAAKPDPTRGQISIELGTNEAWPGKFNFRGLVSERRCLDSRSVTVRTGTTGFDPYLDDVGTNEQGEWETSNFFDADGRYAYAVLEPSVHGGRQTCSGAISRTVRLGLPASGASASSVSASAGVLSTIRVEAKRRNGKVHWRFSGRVVPKGRATVCSKASRGLSIMRVSPEVDRRVAYTDAKGTWTTRFRGLQKGRYYAVVEPRVIRRNGTVRSCPGYVTAVLTRSV